MTSIFDGIAPSQTATYAKLSTQEAFLAVGFATMAADGDMAASEQQFLAMSMIQMKAFREMTPDQFRDALNKVIAILKKEGEQYLFEAAKRALEPPLRETAFVFAADLALADGILDDSEKELLSRLQNILDVDPARARSVVEVVLIKHRG